MTRNAAADRSARLLLQVCTFEPHDMAVHVAFSQDSKHLLMDIKDRTLVVCDVVEPRSGAARYAAEPAAAGGLVIAQQLRPPQGLVDSEKLRLKPTFGGKGEAFVAVGSQLGDVLLWHWPTGKFLASVCGHQQSVNDVAWSPLDPHMLVSCSDDHTLRVWTSPAAVRA
jgi:WD40 repeat protein